MGFLEGNEGYSEIISAVKLYKTQTVLHTSQIGKACYLAFGSTVGAYVTIENNVFVGQSAAIVSGKIEYVGSNSIIGAGSVVITNVEPNTIVAGNPAKFIKDK